MHSGDNYNAEESIKQGYEVTDLNATIIAFFLGALAFLCAGAIAVILIFQRGFDNSRPPLNQTARSPVADHMTQRPPEGTALLQLDPVADKNKAFEEARAKLNGQGYVTQEEGAVRVHIPIETAMEMVAKGDVPYRQAPTAATEETPAE